MKRTLDEIWDLLIELNIATQEEIQLVTTINGYNEETLNGIIYAKTGYRDIEQLEDCE